jgi:asparagine synthase (glutamine-hydrolysing)
VPIHEWFLGQTGEFARRELSDFCDKTDFLDRPAVMNLMQSGRGRDAWFLLNFALWWKQFIQDESPSIPRPTEALAATH